MNDEKKADIFLERMDMRMDRQEFLVDFIKAERKRALSRFLRVKKSIVTCKRYINGDGACVACIEKFIDATEKSK